MSWGAYVTSMTSQGALHCAIYTKDGGVECCRSDGFSLSPTEIEYIKNCHSGKDSKLVLNEQPCIMTKVDEDCVQGKTKDNAHGDNKIFYHCEFTKNYIIITGMSGANERSASKIANHICVHLKDSGC